MINLALPQTSICMGSEYVASLEPQGPCRYVCNRYLGPNTVQMRISCGQTVYYIAAWTLRGSAGATVFPGFLAPCAACAVFVSVSFSNREASIPH